MAQQLFRPSPVNDPESPQSNYFWERELARLEAVPADRIPPLARKFAGAVTDALDLGRPYFPKFGGFNRA